MGTASPRAGPVDPSGYSTGPGQPWVRVLILDATCPPMFGWVP